MVALAVTLQAIVGGEQGGAAAQNPRASRAEREKGLSTAQREGRGTAQQLYEVGQWRPAQWELERLPREQRADFEMLHATSRMGDPIGTLERVEDFDRLWPKSTIYDRDVRFMAAFAYFHQRKWTQAVAEFQRAGTPTKELEDEYNFKRGYALFALGEDEAELWFTRVGEEPWKPHALYYLAHLDYLNGRWEDARQQFQRLAAHKDYAEIVPYYLLQIEFQEGNNQYVIDHAPKLLEKASATRKNELRRVLAESNFYLKAYENTLQEMRDYAVAGGKMGRQEHYIVGYAEYMLGDNEQALESLAQAVGPDDRLSQNAAYHMAAAAMELGQKRAAMQSFSIAATGAYDPDIQEDALFNYGKLQYDLGGGVFNEAMNVLQRYIDTYPQSPRVGEATEYLASAYYNSKNYKAAYEAIQRVKNPDSNLRTALQRVAYLRALELLNDGQSNEAYDMLGVALRNAEEPKYTGLTQFWMGEILARRGQWREAGERLRNYVNVAPTTAPEYRMALYDLGYVHFNRQEWAVSRGWFERFAAAYRTPDNYRADALNRIGDAFYAVRDFWKAIESYDNAAAMRTDMRPYAEFQSAMMYGHVNRPGEKERALRTIVGEGQSSFAGEAQFELGRAYIAREQFEEAARAMLRYTAAYPEGPHYLAALADLGLIAQNMGNDGEAIKYYKQVAATAPQSTQAKDAMLALRSLYVSQNNVDEYFDFAQKAGIESDLGAVQRDSLAFAAASGSGVGAMETYLRRYPKGAYRAEALYRVAEASADPKATMKYYSEIADMHFNDYTTRSLERLAELAEKSGDTAQAADAWGRLAAASTSTEVADLALAGQLRNVAAQGDDKATAVLAAQIAAKATTDDLRQKANLARGEALARSNKAEALQAYRAAADDMTTAEGTRAALRVVESLFAAGDLDGAQRTVMQMAEKSGAHQSDLARAFLILGDIYASKGDKFQARATWQSIADGYSDQTDGIVEQAKRKIETL